MSRIRPIAVDLFAGAGGLSLGFEQAGFDVVAAVEIDPIHALVHKFNFPDCTVIPRSVVGLTGEEIRSVAKIEGSVDVVFGGPPCQGFSLMGQRAIDDPRNSLVKEFVRIVRELDASYFVFENVKGLTVGKHVQFLQELIAEFRTIGYEVRLPWKVLNAAHYGVPQDRQRLIVLGAKAGLPLPQYPDPSTVPAGTGVAGTAGPSCGEALCDLPDAEAYDALLDGDCVSVAKWGTPSAYGRQMRCIDGDAWGYGYVRKWDPDRLTASMRTVHTDISKGRFEATPPGSVEPISRFFRLPQEGVSNTLRAGTDSARGAFTSPRPIHYAHPRCITVREMARLHSFPDWFRFHVTKWHGARQIGNAVPPLLARAIASQVLRAAGWVPQRPETVVELGAPEWLEVDMTGAAAFWGVASPIGKRDRKSDHKKRKQSDIQ